MVVVTCAFNAPGHRQQLRGQEIQHRLQAEVA
jgi:hypothetical protein